MADLSGYRVLVSDKCDAQGLKILRDAGVQVVEKTGLSETELCKTIPEFDGLLIRSGTKVTPKVIEAGNKLIIVARAGVGVNNVNLPAATKRGVVVVNSPEGNTIAAAEHTWSMVLALARNIPQAHNKLTVQGQWDRKLMGTEMAGKTLGVIGFGRIGRRVCQYARGMDMKVLAYDPFVNAGQAQRAGAKLCDLDDVLRGSDFLTLHMPATKETTHMINSDALAKAKKGVMIANVARGELIDESALYSACKSGHVAGAALDVFAQEPPKWDSPLLGLPNVISTPHLGASTKEAQIKVAVDVCQQMVEVFRGGPARSAVNIPSMRPELIKPVQKWIPIGEKLGRLAAFLLGERGMTTVNVEYSGEIARVDPSPVTTVLLKGLLTRSSGSGVVNFVNAPLIAKERGLKLTTHRAPEGSYSSLITVRATDLKGKHLTVAGTSFSEGLGDRLCGIFDIPLEVPLEGPMCFIRNRDTPGALAETCAFLARKGINIADLAIGRQTKNGDAVQAMRLDTEVDDMLCREIEASLETVQSCVAITFTTPSKDQSMDQSISGTYASGPRARL
eukprot:TRINITY_DN56439_c0_g1_i1.p1 TRINITY_DN56439_c0_g1~~TRINITY_DN56439_c0_g1_i1.p1  ORF type:complete len:589 (+),score=241.77 TRINITY_DN56439_c0_g1_i1:83-1768(+)